MEDEYEVITTSPIRRLEDRLERVERTGSSQDINRLVNQIIELIKSNQQTIDRIMKSDAELRDEMSRIPGKIDELVSSMNEFTDLLKASGGMDSRVLAHRMEEMVEHTRRANETNKAILTTMGSVESRLKRLYTQPGYQQR